LCTSAFDIAHLTLFYKRYKIANIEPAGAFKNGNFIMFTKLITYFKEVRLEMKKVNWPTRQDTMRFTAIVVAISLGVAVILGAFDFIFTGLLVLIV